MKKISQTDAEFSSLVSDLFGESVAVPAVSSAPEETQEGEEYQLPVRHNISGAEIDEENKPTVTSAFEQKPFYRELYKRKMPHNGVDLSAPRGAPVYPIAPGIVKSVQPTERKPVSKFVGGITVHITHEDGKVLSYYAHLDSAKVSPDQEVGFDTVIGTVGNSGNARTTPPHLHYQVWVDGALVDPQKITGKEIGTLHKTSELVKGLINKYNAFSDPDSPKERIREFKRIIKQDESKPKIRGSRKKNP